ncbi:MAG: cupin domain-containing protein [Gammaproteobacteria bacterium]|nr:cupin domain-containing protein [Gammaproteobacteria bacterium]
MGADGMHDASALMEGAGSMDVATIHSEILSVMERMVDTSENPHVQRFRSGFEGVRNTWRDVGSGHLPTAALLDSIRIDAGTLPGRLVALVSKHRKHLLWEQTYRKEDDVVGEDLLAGYGFSEVTGKRGPYVSERLRSGIGIWAPHVKYPLHWHDSEEIYWVLSGSARFQVGRDEPASLKKAGDVVFMPSAVPHAFWTAREPFVVFYLWQGGDLRQVSEFESRIG